MAKTGQWADQPTKDDRLGFQDYRRTLVEVILQADTPITVGIFGAWGSGKTSLMRMVQVDLEKGEAGKSLAKTVWFDAWKYDEKENLWRALLLSALEELRGDPEQEDRELDDLQASLYRDVDREEAGSWEIDWREGAKGTLKLGLSFLPLLPALSEGILRKLGTNEKDPTGMPKDAVGHLINMFKRERIRIHRDRVQFLKDFQNRFGELVQKRIPEGMRFVVFIDDLDRCLPEKAIEVLEAIKLFLDAERCVFMVGVERRIIEQGIKVKYRSFAVEGGEEGIPISGDEYLEKIVQVPFHLPPLEEGNIAEFAYGSLTEEFGRPVAEVFARGMEANPRKIKRVLNIFRLLWTLARNRGMIEKGDIEADLLAKVVVIQTRWRDKLYADVVEYPKLLENLEDHFERMRQKAEAPPQLPPEGGKAAPPETASSVVEGSQPPEVPQQETLVDRYARLKSLEKILLMEGTNRFKGKGLRPYIYLTATAVEKRTQEDFEVSIDERIWEDLMSDDPTRIEAAVGRIEERERSGYVKRLLAIISDQKANDLKTRIAAGNALGMLGDSRLDEMEMIPVPAGPFKMGTEGEGNESPQREVYLDAFEIAKFPLTNVQYKAFLDANPDHPEPQDWNSRTFPLGKVNHPVVNISWDDAQTYAEWLNKKTGKHYRLPTEAEWEKVARGADGREYPWEGEFDSDKCNTREGGVGGTTPVGIYSEGASPYGVMDMVGNVWEWCADRYGPYEKAESRNPQGPKKGEGRVVRGGSWFNHRAFARCASRSRLPPDYRLVTFGVRFSRTP